MTKDSGFNSQQGEDTCLLSQVSRLSLGPTQIHIQCELGTITHLPLITSLKMHAASKITSELFIQRTNTDTVQTKFSHNYTRPLLQTLRKHAQKDSTM
jgi:hypothetical protein